MTMFQIIGKDRYVNLEWSVSTFRKYRELVIKSSMKKSKISELVDKGKKILTDSLPETPYSQCLP